MTKILCTILVSIIITAAVAYVTQVIIGEVGVKILEIQHNEMSGDLIAVVKNNGEMDLTIRGYEVFDRAKNEASRKWDQTSMGNVDIKLASGETQKISLGSHSAPDDSQDFGIKLHAMNSSGRNYTVSWNSDR